MKKIVFVIFVIFSFVLLVVAYKQSFPIRKITCESQVGKCPDELVNKFSGLLSKPLSQVKPELAYILSESVIVKKYAIHYLFPKTLDIKIVQRNPIFGISNSSDDGSWVVLISKDKFATQIVDSTSLPTLIVEGKLPNPSEMVDEKVFFALDLLFDLEKTYNINTGHYYENRLEIVANDDRIIIFPLEGDRRVLLGSMYLIVNWLNTDPKDIKMEEVGGITEVDLRYNNPILR